MDKCEVKQFQVSRGFTYCYYRYSDPNRTKPTLLFIHGFPSSKDDWTYQIEHFVSKGFSIIAVDTLGYGGTSKPTEISAYRATDMAKDIIEVLDFENENKVIAIAHDWGTGTLARIIDNHQDYLTAAVFLNVGYVPQPSTDFDWEQAMQFTESNYGYSVFGYWQYFGNVPGAHITIEKNIDSFYSLIFPHDPELWRTDVCPRGKAQEWIEGNKQAPRAAYFDEKTMRIHQRRLLSGGLEAPLQYYGINFTNLNNRPDPPPPFSTPTLLICCTKDYVSVVDRQIQRMQIFAQNLTVEKIDCGHWIMFEKPELLNERLEHFLDNLKPSE